MKKEEIKIGQLFVFYEKAPLGCFDNDESGAYVITQIFSHAKTGKLTTYVCCLFSGGSTTYTTIDELLGLINGNGFYFNGVTPHVAIDYLIKEFPTWNDAVSSQEFKNSKTVLNDTFKKLKAILDVVVIPERLELLKKSTNKKSKD